MLKENKWFVTSAKTKKYEKCACMLRLTYINHKMTLNGRMPLRVSKATEDLFLTHSLLLTHYLICCLFKRHEWNVKWGLNRASLIIMGQSDRGQDHPIAVAMTTGKIWVANKWALKLQVQGKSQICESVKHAKCWSHWKSFCWMVAIMILLEAIITVSAHEQGCWKLLMPDRLCRKTGRCSLSLYSCSGMDEAEPKLTVGGSDTLWHWGET